MSNVNRHSRTSRGTTRDERGPAEIRGVGDSWVGSKELACALPKSFCWSRFGTEAGETIDSIIRRKEEERESNGGVFLWGIGNAIAPSMRQLVQLEPMPEVIFSPIRSRPKPEDISPTGTVVWTRGRDLNGAPYALPRASVVTSRYKPGLRTARHYALVCYSERPLEIQPSATTVNIRCLRNLLTNNVVGASQVTAVVRQIDYTCQLGSSYPVAMRIRLVAPYLIELLEPRWHVGDPRATRSALPLSRHPEFGGLPSLAAHTN